MTPKQWNEEMTQQQRHEYLQGKETCIHSAMGANGASKVGEVEVIQLYAFSIGDICSGYWYLSEDQAQKQADTFRKNNSYVSV